MDTTNKTDNIWLIFPEEGTHKRQKYFISLLNKIIEEEISRPVLICDSYEAAKEKFDKLIAPSCMIIYTESEFTSANRLSELVYAIREIDFYLPLLLVCSRSQLIKIPVPTLTKFDGFIWKDQVNLSPSIQTIKTALNKFEAEYS